MNRFSTQRCERYEAEEKISHGFHDLDLNLKMSHPQPSAKIFPAISL